MELKGKKVLVTGAGGFIGSHLTEALLAKSGQVRAFIHYNSLNSRGWLDGLKPEIKTDLDVFAGDIRDPHGVEEAMRDRDVVFHLAALIAIPYSYSSPSSYIETNVKGTLNVVQAARKLDLEKVLHTSTSEVYGTAKFVPITEDHPLQAQSPYSASKIGADQIAVSYYHSFDTPVVIVRPFNTYGPRQSARAIIPTIITQIAGGGRSLHLGSLEPTRDFNFVTDTVDGFIALAESDRTIGETVNLGSNFEISMGETARLIAGIMGADVEITADEQRLRPEKSEVWRLRADNTKAEKLAGWRPRHGGREGFTYGLTKTIEWFTDPENLKMYKSNIYNV